MPDTQSPASDNALHRIATVCSIEMAIIVLLQVLCQQSLYFVNGFGKRLGIDYYDPYYIGSRLLHLGQTPYLHGRYSAPPFFAAFNAIFLPIDPQILSYGLSVLSFGILFGCCFFFYKFFHLEDTIPRAAFLRDTLLMIAFSFPFLFLFDRANIDALVLLALWGGLFFLPTAQWLTGFFFATGFALKLYPIILIVPLLILKKTRAAVSFLLFCGVYVLLQYDQWSIYGLRLLRRTTAFRLDENGSLSVAFFYLGKLWDRLVGTGGQAEWPCIGFSAVAYGLVLLATAACDARIRYEKPADQCGLVLTYFPFMVALPKLVYLYEFIVLLPLAFVCARFARRQDTPAGRRLAGLLAVAIALTQFQGVAFSKLTGSLLWQVVPSLSLLAVMLLLLYAKWRAMMAERTVCPASSGTDSGRAGGEKD